MTPRPATRQRVICCCEAVLRGAACILALLAACKSDALPGREAPAAERAQGQGLRTGDEAQPRLAASSAGRACSDDDDCPGGRCQQAEGSDGARYCTRACDTTSQCGLDGACASVSDGDDKQCFAVCSVQSDCREGFVCAGAARTSRISLIGACRPKRAVGQLADEVAGQACEADADCAGGRCATTNLLGTRYPGNYCTGRCYEDSQCGQGGTCLSPRGSIDPGHCLESCAEHADCEREGYRCWELGDGARVVRACYPGSEPLHTTGQACSEDAECGAAPARCARELPFGGLVTNEVTTAPQGYCTQACALDEECGGAWCINYGTSGGICLARCSDDAPCRAGYVCVPHQRDGKLEDQACVPREVDSTPDGGA